MTTSPSFRRLISKNISSDQTINEEYKYSTSEVGKNRTNHNETGDDAVINSKSSFAPVSYGENIELDLMNTGGSECSPKEHDFANEDNPNESQHLVTATNAEFWWVDSSSVSKIEDSSDLQNIESTKTDSDSTTRKVSKD